MNILGLKIVSHDTGAALISGNRVVAIAEERLNRVKHSRDMFPELAIEYCLNALNVKPEQVDLIVIDQMLLRSVIKTEKLFRAWGGAQRFTKARIEVINHHDAHAASAFFCSPFSEAAVLVYDGGGETFMKDGIPVNETETLYYGQKNTLSILSKMTHPRINKGYPYTWGIGKMYAFFSSVYLNFGSYNEGKMMGLSSYGTSKILEQFPKERWVEDHEGNIFCNSQISYPQGANVSLDASDTAKEEASSFIHGMLKIIKAVLKRPGDENIIIPDPHYFKPIELPRPPREKEALPDEYYSSIAYAVQRVLEEVAVLWGSKLKKLSKSENLVIAGGVGLNIDANKNFLDRVGFKHVWVQPGASDTGIALGCALYGAHMIEKRPRFWEMKSAALGRQYADHEIIDALKKFEDKVTFKRSNNVCRDTATLLSKGAIIGWHQGGAEYGPRALGNRSILMDARGKEAKDTLNNRVKHREPWRPFAASVLEEKMSDWFELTEPSRFMLLAAPVKKDKSDMVPAIVHIDGTCRIQSVTPESNKKYYELIKEFEKITGIPLLLNTSFNLGGDPIVETPWDSLDTFTRTRMDYLILEDYIVEKK